MSGLNGTIHPLITTGFTGLNPGRRLQLFDLLNSSIREFENLERQASEMNQMMEDRRSASGDFVNTLEEVNVTQDMIDQRLECAICMEAFKENDKCVKLPCTDHPHYFHYGHEGSECSGIKPWLQRNNTCPVCRTEFPMEQTAVQERIIEMPDAPMPDAPMPDSPMPDSPMPVPIITNTPFPSPPPALIPINNTDLTPEQVEVLQNNTNITNIIEDNRITDIIQNNIMNAFISGVRRERLRIRNEEAEMQRAIELSLL